MSSDGVRREPSRSASFHDVSAQNLYTHQFRKIGIAAVAASAGQRAVRRATPLATDIPAILRFGPEAE